MVREDESRATVVLLQSSLPYPAVESELDWWYVGLADQLCVYYRWSILGGARKCLFSGIAAKGEEQDFVV